MKKTLCTLLCFIMVFGVISIYTPVAADDYVVNQALPLNIQPVPAEFSGVTFLNTSFSSIEYGDLVCSIDIQNTSTNAYMLPIYINGKDSGGKIIEVGSININIPQASSSYPVTVKKQIIRLKAGFFIKSLETGLIGKSNDNIVLSSYGVRRDDSQNKIIVTGNVKDNYPYPYSKDVTVIKQNAGIVAQGYDSNGKVVEVQGDTSNVPNGMVKTFELTFSAGSMISRVDAHVTGNSQTSVVNLFGTRVEKGKNIITGNIENNPYNQYIQVIAKGYSLGKVVAVDGLTLSVEKNANANYRFELDQHNGFDKVEVQIRKQEEIVGKADLIAYSTLTVNSKIIVDALVSSGYYKDKNLGIIISGMNIQGSLLETNAAVVPFRGNGCIIQHVTASLDAGDAIKMVKAELAGTMEDDIVLKQCGKRVENDTYLVTNIIENGNTVAQTAGVMVLGMDANGKIIEVTGYSDNIPANSTKQYKSILTNTKDIKNVKAEFVGLVKGDLQEQHAMYNDANNTVVSGILLNGTAKQDSGIIAMSKDKKGNIIDINCLYSTLNENTITPFLIRLNNTNFGSINTYTAEASKLKPVLNLDGAGFFKQENTGIVNAVITNGTSLPQQCGIISIGYNSKGKAVDMNAMPPININAQTVMKVQNSFNNIDQISTAKSYLYGINCSTGLLASSFRKAPDNRSAEYSLCITNGASEQTFNIVTTIYDKTTKKATESTSSIRISKYSAGVVKINIDLQNTLKAYLKIYDSTGKKLTGKGISDLAYQK